jgi:hypothetical protein
MGSRLVRIEPTRLIGDSRPRPTGDVMPEPTRLPKAEPTELDGDKVELASGLSTRSALAPAHNKQRRGLQMVVKSLELKRGR